MGSDEVSSIGRLEPSVATSPTTQLRRLGIRKTVGVTIENTDALGKFVRFSLQETMETGVAIQCVLNVENGSVNNKGGFSTRRLAPWIEKPGQQCRRTVKNRLCYPSFLPFPLEKVPSRLPKSTIIVNRNKATQCLHVTDLKWLYQLYLHKTLER
ncbi:hypothetical protein MRX96_006561 [Rhipicephalus microplus]